MKTMKSLVSLVLVLMLALSMVTAASAEARTDLVFALYSEPSALCGGFAASVTVNMVSRQIFDTLIIHENGEFIPGLATDWSWSEGNTKLTLTLREGVKFHNGETMTAEDVAYSYNTIIAAGYADTATSAMDKMEVVDDSHVALTFKAEYGPALDCVSSDYMTIFPKAYYEADPDGFNRNPCGTGAYKFVSWSTGDKIILTANEDYWRGAASIKDVTYRIMSDANVATIALQNGEIDVHYSVPQTDIDIVANDPNLQYSEVVGNSTTWIIFNHNEGHLFTDERLRLAVAHALDKEEIMLAAIEGHGTVAQAIYSSIVPAYDHDYVGPAYDPDLSMELLAEAGYPDGLDLVVKTNSRATYAKPLEIVQAYLADVGINISIEKMDTNAWFDDVFKGPDYEMNLVTFSMGMADLEELYALYRGGEGQNFGNLNDPEVNAAYDANHTSVDPEVRDAAFKTVQHVMGDKALCIPIYSANNCLAANKNLQGISADSMNEYTFWNWSWAE